MSRGPPILDIPGGGDYNDLKFRYFQAAPRHNV